jgi:hypothetical protein
LSDPAPLVPDETPTIKERVALTTRIINDLERQSLMEFDPRQVG